jgi:hypothetical protein
LGINVNFVGLNLYFRAILLAVIMRYAQGVGRRRLGRRRRGYWFGGFGRRRRFQFADNQLLVGAGGHQLGGHRHHFG